MALLDKLSLDKDSDEEFDFEADDVGLEKDLSFRTSQSRAAFTRRLPYFAAEFKKRWNNLNTCMVLIVFGLVILLILPSKGGVRPEIALNDVNNLTPKFALQSTLFLNDSRYIPDRSLSSNFPSSLNKTLERWEALIPGGQGLVQVSNPEQHMLPPPLTAGNHTNLYYLSMFHQLHCLMMIMKYFNYLVIGGAYAELPRPIPHIDHCFDFLRQTIMCFGDTTLEGQSPYREKFLVDGNGAQHMCKNFDEVFEWAESVRVEGLEGHIS